MLTNHDSTDESTTFQGAGKKRKYPKIPSKTLGLLMLSITI